MSRGESGVRGFANPLTGSTSLNKTTSPSASIRCDWLKTRQLTASRGNVHPHKQSAFTHTHTHENPLASLWGPLGESQAWHCVVKGFPGGKMCKDSHAGLSHGPRGGRAAPRGSVTNRRLSGLDNGRWTSVIPSVHMLDNTLQSAE